MSHFENEVTFLMQKKMGKKYPNIYINISIYLYTMYLSKYKYRDKNLLKK